MPKFEVVSPYQPSGDQPEAIDALAAGNDLNTNAGEAGEVFTGIGEKIASAVVMKGVSVAADALGTLKDKAVEAAEYVVEVGSSFEARMSEVEAISGATGSELEIGRAHV